MSSSQVGSPAPSLSLLSISGANTSVTRRMSNTCWTPDSELSTQPSTRQNRLSESSAPSHPKVTGLAVPCLFEASGEAYTLCPEESRPDDSLQTLGPTIYERNELVRHLVQHIDFLEEPPIWGSWYSAPPMVQMWPSTGESHGIIPSRHRVVGKSSQTLAANEVYIGLNRATSELMGRTRLGVYRCHGQTSAWGHLSKWASPFTVGRHGTIKECLIMYTGYISSCHLAGEIHELIGKRLLSDTPEDTPCIADILIALVCHAWRTGSLSRYPIWDLDILHDHVVEAGLSFGKNRHPHEMKAPNSGPRHLQEDHPDREPQGGQHQNPQHVWRQPGQAGVHVPIISSSSTSHFSSQSVKLGQGDDITQDDEDRYGNVQAPGHSPFIIGGSQSSMFEPHNASPASKADDAFESSSCDNGNETWVSMSRAFPLDRGSKEATFTALSADFRFDDKVRGLFLKGPMNSLADFRDYFTDEKEIAAFVAEGGSSEEPEQRLRISRVRQAWTAVRQHSSHSDNCSTTPSASCLDNLLDDATLRQVKVQFWKRHKSSYPAEVFPSDQLLSRCYNEMDRRLLTVYDIDKVDSLLHQVMTAKPGRRPETHSRKHISTHMEPDADLCTIKESLKRYWRRGQWKGHQPGNNEVDRYLARLYSYLLALAIAGSSKIHGAPTDEALGTDSTKFVNVPWDVLQAYYFRAHQSVMRLPEASRLAWIKETDVAERAVWVSQFRSSSESLGRVLQSIMRRRGAHWEVPTQGTGGPLPSPFPSRQPPLPGTKRQRQYQQHRQAALQATKKTALSANPLTHRCSMQQQQGMRARRFLARSSHTRRIDRNRDPIATKPNIKRLSLIGMGTSSSVHLGTIRLSGGLAMKHPSLCSIFTSLLFMDDFVRQALTDRTALLSEVQAQLKYFKHLVESHNEWEMEVAIEEYSDYQSSHHFTEDRLCLSCGVNPGARHLGYDECSSCYDEH